MAGSKTAESPCHRTDLSDLDGWLVPSLAKCRAVFAVRAQWVKEDESTHSPSRFFEVVALVANRGVF